MSFESLAPRRWYHARGITPHCLSIDPLAQTRCPQPGKRTLVDVESVKAFYEALPLKTDHAPMCSVAVPMWCRNRVARCLTDMTRLDQKQYERVTLRTLLSILGIPADTVCEEGETPDFLVQINGESIGIEMTRYQSGQVVAAASIERRAVEAEWERFNCFSKSLREEQPELKKISVIFRFKNVVPPSRERQLFLAEIVNFIRLHQYELGHQYVIFSLHQFVSQLMMKYLTDLCLCISERAHWDSNLTAGKLSPFVGAITRIIREKSTKRYRRAAKLWLVIQCSGLISETALPLNDADEFNRNVALGECLRAGRFARVFISTAMGWFHWDRLSEWKKI